MARFALSVLLSSGPDSPATFSAHRFKQVISSNPFAVQTMVVVTVTAVTAVIALKDIYLVETRQSCWVVTQVSILGDRTGR
jgi:hypothetical protein